MALNPSSVTFNAAYPLTGGKWRVDFTSPMINGFPFQYIQDFYVKWANFTAADTGLESVTVGGVTKLVGDSSAWAINSSSPISGYATFATSAPAIANSNVVFQHTEYGEEEDFGGGGGGGGGGPIPVTTDDFVNLSVTIEAAADGFSPNPYLLAIAAGAGNQFPTASTLTVGYSISDLTVTYPANFWADMGMSDASFGNNWETTHSSGSESSATGNLNSSTAQVNLTVFEAGPPATVSKTITVHATNSVTASVTDYDLTFTITRPGAATDNVTVADLNLESVVSSGLEAVTVADLALQTSVFEPVSVADLGLNANVFEPVTVADLALESNVVEGVTVAELNLSITVYEAVAAPILALNTVVLDVVQPSINLVLRVTEPVPEAVNVANLRLISVVETPEPVTVQNLKLTAIVADGAFAFNPNTSFCGELS